MVTLHSILNDYLHGTKLCFFWVPQSLTLDQKAGHVKWRRDTLKIFNKSILIWCADKFSKQSLNFWRWGYICICKKSRVEKKKISVFFTSSKILQANKGQSELSGCLKSSNLLKFYELTFDSFISSLCKNLQLFDHPPYSPDLTLWNFALLFHVKINMKVRQFSNDEHLLRGLGQWCIIILHEM